MRLGATLSIRGAPGGVSMNFSDPTRGGAGRVENVILTPIHYCFSYSFTFLSIFSDCFSLSFLMAFSDVEGWMVGRNDCVYMHIVVHVLCWAWVLSYS